MQSRRLQNKCFPGDKSLFLGWHGSEACSTRFAANDNDDENDNFHMEVNCQFSIIHYQFAAPQLCHATPKINFCHLGMGCLGRNAWI